MSRQQRRQQSRKGKPPFPWEKLVIALIAVFFVGTAAFTYLFPTINARSYSTGSTRVQKILISRGLEDLKTQSPYEFLYFATELEEEEEEMNWLRVKESSDKIIISDVDDEVEEYALNSPPEYYLSVRDTIADVQSALKDKSFKVRHPQPEEKDLQALLLEKKNDDMHLIYVLYFTPDHQVDGIHVLELGTDEEYGQRVYSGLITGIPETEND